MVESAAEADLSGYQAEAAAQAEARRQADPSERRRSQDCPVRPPSVRSVDSTYMPSDSHPFRGLATNLGKLIDSIVEVFQCDQHRSDSVRRVQCFSSRRIDHEPTSHRRLLDILCHHAGMLFVVLTSRRFILEFSRLNARDEGSNVFWMNRFDIFLYALIRCCRSRSTRLCYVRDQIRSTYLAGFLSIHDALLRVCR